MDVTPVNQYVQPRSSGGSPTDDRGRQGPSDADQPEQADDPFAEAITRPREEKGKRRPERAEGGEPGRAVHGAPTNLGLGARDRQHRGEESWIRQRDALPCLLYTSDA